LSRYDRSAKPLKVEQLRVVLALPGPKRYEHFVKQVADTQKVWSLRDESGWVCSTTDEGTDVLPLWPHSDYASLAATGEWAGCQPHAIELRKLMEEMVPSFGERGVGVLIFPTPDDKGVVPPLEQLLSDIRAELTKY
jgi:Protein of unknown function (DUF2750)